MTRAFRLATVERLRAARLDDCARALAVARQGVVAAVAHHDAVADELAGCAPSGATTTHALEAARIRREVLRERLDAASRDVDAARERAGAAVRTWTGARADLKAVEVLHERHREALREADARREQRLLDDLAGTRRRPLGAAW